PTTAANPEGAAVRGVSSVPESVGVGQGSDLLRAGQTGQVGAVGDLGTAFGGLEHLTGAVALVLARAHGVVEGVHLVDGEHELAGHAHHVRRLGVPADPGIVGIGGGGAVDGAGQAAHSGGDGQARPRIGQGHRVVGEAGVLAEVIG